MPSLLLPADLTACARASAFLREHLAEYEDTLPFVELAAEELVVNVARHAYAGSPRPGSEDMWGRLELCVDKVSMDDEPAIRLRLRDWGRQFDPFADAPRPDVSLDAEDRPIGGLGVHLVRNVAAHHCYCDSDGANTLELFFKLRPSGAA